MFQSHCSGQCEHDAAVTLREAEYKGPADSGNCRQKERPGDPPSQFSFNSNFAYHSSEQR